MAWRSSAEADQAPWRRRAPPVRQAAEPVQDVVAAAGTSVGAFYRRFGDKDGLLTALEARYREERAATIASEFDAAAWQGVGLAARVEAFAAFLVAFKRKHTGLFRALLMRSLRQSPAEPRPSPRDVSGYLRFLLACRGEMTHPDPETATYLGFEAMNDLTSRVIVFGYAGVPEAGGIDDERLALECVRLFLGYVGHRG